MASKPTSGTTNKARRTRAKYSFNPKPGSPIYDRLRPIAGFKGWIKPIMRNTIFEQMAAQLGSALGFGFTFFNSLDEPYKNGLTQACAVGCWAGQSVIRKWFDYDSNDPEFIAEMNKDVDEAGVEQPSKAYVAPSDHKAAQLAREAILLGSRVDPATGKRTYRLDPVSGKQMYKALASLTGNLLTIVGIVNRGFVSVATDPEQRARTASVQGALDGAVPLARWINRSVFDDGLGNWAGFFTWIFGSHPGADAPIPSPVEA